MRHVLGALTIIGLIGLGVFWWLSTPRNVRIDLEGTGDAAHGARVATAMGCASCHGEDFAGGMALGSPFGIFYVPNITPSAIGHWSDQEIVNAVIAGVRPDGQHYYPVFPYRSYALSTPADLVDLIAYLRTLPPVDRADIPHDLSIIAAWRRPVGIWKLLAGRRKTVDPNDRGTYLAEAQFHCQECHTPRNALGLPQPKRAYDGGALYGTDGRVKTRVPSLIDGEATKWSAGEMFDYLTTGFTPDFDTASAEMVDVIENIAQLPEGDQRALTDYVLSLRPGGTN